MKKKQFAAWMTAAALVTGTWAGTMGVYAEEGEPYYEDTVTLSLLVDQNWLDQYGEALTALSDAVLEKYNIQIELENKTNGSDGDNLVKTRLAAG